MIYLIGGPPRVGKSLLAKKFVSVKAMYAFSCDFTYDTYDFTATVKFKRADIVEKGNMFYPKLEELVGNIVRQTENCVIDGEVILPHHVVALSKKHNIRACFLGLSDTSLDKILTYGGHFNWPKHKLENGMESEVIGLAKLTAVRSEIIESECLKHGQPYLDLAVGDYDEGIQKALQILIDS